MKTPRLFRPMFTLGIIVTLGAVFTYLMVPGMRATTGGVALLLVLLLIGIAAIGRDLFSLGQELKELTEANKKQPPED